jgi:hypothetical protein
LPGTNALAYFRLGVVGDEEKFENVATKDEIDDIRDSLDRLEAEGERRKAKLLEQVSQSDQR